MGLTTFEDPLGLGLGTLPTSEHADKMVKQGERKIKLGTILHSGRLVSCEDELLGRLSVEIAGLMGDGRMGLATTRSDFIGQGRAGPYACN
jgi:hypothetical protein